MEATIKNVIEAAQQLIDNGLIAAAEELIKIHKFKLYIKDGKVIDDCDHCESNLLKFFTVSPVMLEVKQAIRKLAVVQDEVLITGPTGTGKELLASALHGRRDGMFKAINCAGLPESLVESELFGHVQGAFTGALREQPGLFQIANGGTIFLDEISELPMPAQGKLLRAIQSRRVRKVGGKSDEAISCRIVCATNRDLSEMCNEHKFRLDLYARISTFELPTIGLDDRPEDVEVIYRGLKAPDVLIEHVLKNRTKHHFNVRSIQQYIRRYNVLGSLP